MKSTCTRCGAIDLTGTQFRRERIPFFGTRIYCSKCHAVFQDKVLLGLCGLNLIFGLIGAICLGLNHTSKIGHVYLNVFLFQICTWPSILLHEFAHAIVGKSFGLTVLRVWIGRGKTFFKKRILGFDTEFKLLPLGGLVFFTHRPIKQLRLRYFASVLAGPLSNALMALIAWHFTSWQMFDLESSLQFWPSLLIIQIIFAVTNLIPYRFQTDAGKINSDGLSLIQLMFSTKPAVLQPHLIFNPKPSTVTTTHKLNT